MPKPGYARWGLLALLLVPILTACGGGGSPTAGVTPTRGYATTADTFTSPLPVPPTLPPLVLGTRMGGAKGALAATPSDWAGQELTVWFASYYSGGDQGGFFMLEPSQAPSTTVAGTGAFQLGSIPPGEYVVVIGPNAEAALAVRQGDKPQIFTVAEGEVLDLGQVSLP